MRHGASGGNEAPLDRRAQPRSVWHESAVDGADVAGRGEVSDPKADVPDQVGRNKIVTRIGVNEGNALDRLDVQRDVHHW